MSVNTKVAVVRSTSFQSATGERDKAEVGSRRTPGGGLASFAKLLEGNIRRKASAAEPAAATVELALDEGRLSQRVSVG
jgi:hypothetical protein